MLRLLVAAALIAGGAVQAQAQSLRPGQGKLLLTGGVSTIDGAAGGGLTPWALTASYATEGEFGATAFATRVRTQDYALTAYGAAVGVHDRIEISLARQDFDTGANLAPLGFGGLHLKLDTVGLKWRVAGDAILDSDRWLPQLALGVLHKRLQADDFAPVLSGVLGAKREGTELYFSATKLLLAHSLLLNATLRATNANQGGLLGFGSTRGERYTLQPEVSLAWLLRRDLAIGVEARAKPDALHDSALGAGALAEDDWFDAFIAWAPNKHVSLTLAWVDLGRIAPAVQPRRQTGAYVSAQLAF